MDYGNIVEISMRTIDEVNAKSLVKFFYTGSLEYTNEESLVSFMILANKYKVKNLGEFKVPPKVYLNGILAYVEKDLNNRLGEFDKLAESINFKKMEKEDLTKLYAKKKWLQKSSSFLNIIIMKDMDDDSEGSGSSKDSEDEESESKESSDEEGGGGSLAVFDPKASHSSWTYDKKTKMMKCNNGSWYSAISKKPHDKFTVELGTGIGSYMIGFIVKSSFNQNAANYNTGQYWYCSSSGLYGQGTRLSFSAGAGCTAGTKIGCIFFRKKMVISYIKDGNKVGDAWQLSDKKIKLMPVIDCCTSGSQFKFIKGKYPKK